MLYPKLYPLNQMVIHIFVYQGLVKHYFYHKMNDLYNKFNMGTKTSSQAFISYIQPLQMKFDEKNETPCSRDRTKDLEKLVFLDVFWKALLAVGSVQNTPRQQLVRLFCDCSLYLMCGMEGCSLDTLQ